MVYVPCKRRFCPVCGPKRRWFTASRIAWGIDLLGDAAWFIGTWQEDVTRECANRTFRKFMAKVRRIQGRRIEYAATWELTQRGRLHVNIIFGEWEFVKQRELSRLWQESGGGSNVWIERVGESAGIEVAKSSYEAAMYVAKFDQMVREGRSVTYSKGWPKLPAADKVERKGLVFWVAVTPEHEAFRVFQDEAAHGYWREVRPGEWVRAGETCDCFDIVRGSPSSE